MFNQCLLFFLFTAALAAMDRWQNGNARSLKRPYAGSTPALSNTKRQAAPQDDKQPPVHV